MVSLLPLLNASYLILLQFSPDHTPAIALFATNSRYKREAYRGSEFAPRILSDEGLKVVMKVRSRPTRRNLSTNVPSRATTPC